MSDIILMDGAFGTSLWEKAEAQGIEKVPTWHYNMEHPELIRELVREYAEAGADCVQANTFSANRFSLKGSPYTVSEIVKAGIRITKEALAGTGKKTVLSVGPLPVLMEPYGDMEEDEAADCYREIFEAARGEGADLIDLETFMDLEMMKVALTEALKLGLPVLTTMTFEKSGRTLMGNPVEEIAKELKEAGASAIGMNCSLGPEEALPVILKFSECTDLPLVFKPNARLPVIGTDGKESRAYSARAFADTVSEAIPFVSYLGGCCGTDPGFIRELRGMICVKH